SWEGTRQMTQPEEQPRGGRSGQKDPTVAFFWCLLAAHVMGWTILPALTQPNVPAETLDLLTAGRELAWGYPEHAPLGVWLVSAAAWWTAPAVWPVYLLAQICTAVNVWAVWQLGRKFLHPWSALCAAVALEGCFF